nr:nuclease-related domain-containing protein [Thalassotalea sp. G2M2-11]
MIVKEMDNKNCKSPNTIAGQQQEKDVAFYLRRAFKDDNQVFVFNDFKFTHNDETAQIDHLILYRFGFILIESKSISGSVKVNSQEEWSRNYRGKWQGMPSPIKQVLLQEQLLKDLLHENRSQLVGKLLGLQQTLGKRSWDHLCAVSSNTLIERAKMPKHISEKLVKSEFLVDAVKNIMDLKNDVLRILTVTDHRPAFNDSEIYAIRTFLLNQCGGEKTRSNNEANEPITFKNKPVSTTVDDVFKPPKNTKNVIISKHSYACKKCRESTLLTPLPGRFGYFLKCVVCEANTPLKKACESCGSKQTKVSKKGGAYTLKCSDCAHEEHLLTTT